MIGGNKGWTPKIWEESKVSIVCILRILVESNPSKYKDNRNIKRYTSNKTKDEKFDRNPQAIRQSSHLISLIFTSLHYPMNY